MSVRLWDRVRAAGWGRQARLNRLDEGFPQVLLRLTDGRGMTDAACYSNRALIAGVFAFDQSQSVDCTGDGGSLYL